MSKNDQDPREKWRLHIDSIAQKILVPSTTQGTLSFEELIARAPKGTFDELDYEVPDIVEDPKQK
jgi:hypothetical protein